MEYPIYHATLSQALDAAINHAANSRASIAQSEVHEQFSEGLKYEETKQAHLSIVELKGKATKKYFHITIYRMSSGTYELTCYIL